MDPDTIEWLFSYHAPKEDQPKRYELLRESAKELARTIVVNCPESEEQTLAINYLRQAVMWANASIALNE